MRGHALQLTVDLLDTPGCRIVNFATGLFADERGRNLAAVRPAKWKRIFALAGLAVLLFGGHVGVGSDLAYALSFGPVVNVASPSD